jgi:hypothetical protein
MVELVTLAKLIHNVVSDPRQLLLAQAALKSAINGLPLGFGKDSAVELEARQLLQDVEMTMQHMIVTRTV